MAYELFYLIGASKEADLEKIKKEIEEIIVSPGGQFLEKTTMEKRRMAYEIKRETHGIYIAQRFELEAGEKIAEISKKINLSPAVLRFLISRADELPELKSKEERMSEAAARDQKNSFRKEVPTSKTSRKELTKKEASTKTPDEKSPEKTESQEDIDKKIEEILNI